MILTLVRHGEPVRDLAGQDAADPPLSAQGRCQMKTARSLVDSVGYEAVYSSPLRRARESAALLVPAGGVIVDDDLAEFDRDAERYLHWEDWPETYQSYLAGDLTAWGTTLEGFRARIWAVVERMRERAPNGHVLAVTHGGVINNLFAMLIGSGRVTLFEPDYGSVNRFLHHPEEAWTPLELNASVAWERVSMQ